MSHLRIRPALPAESDWLQDCFAADMDWPKPPGYFQRVCEQQAAGELVLLLALEAGEYRGHCKLLWQSPYPGFRD
ncbi:MAG: hypothetical protein F4Y70_11590 [Chloroflexi bacterium]|nr:hypothetical protein [Chloroflexota bacterium]